MKFRKPNPLETRLSGLGILAITLYLALAHPWQLLEGLAIGLALAPILVIVVVLVVRPWSWHELRRDERVAARKGEP